MPTVDEALRRLERELDARRNTTAILKVIHGYGSKGLGGEIRIAVQKRLREWSDAGRIRACIFGEEWSRTNDITWKLLQKHPELKDDPDLGRRNQGITVVIL